MLWRNNLEIGITTIARFVAKCDDRKVTADLVPPEADHAPYYYQAGMFSKSLN